MKIRESGMPDESYWESLFDIPLILDRLGINARLKDVVELGCGYGTFTLPAAKRVSGELLTYDIDEQMVERTRLRAETEGISNVTCAVRDVFSDGFGVEPESKDACLLFNILHAEEPVKLLSQAARTVRPGGKVLVIHWRCDAKTPRGPSMEIRPYPESIGKWAEKTRMLFVEAPLIDLPPWHYGVKLVRHPLET